MQKGHADGGLYRGGNFVHGVGGQKDGVCTGLLQSAGGSGEDFTGFVPIAALLAIHDFLKFNAGKQDGRAVVAAFLPVDEAVDLGVVGGGTFGRHAADDAECVHAVFRLGGFQVACGQYGLPEKSAAVPPHEIQFVFSGLIVRIQPQGLQVVLLGGLPLAALYGGIALPA